MAIEGVKGPGASHQSGGAQSADNKSKGSSDYEAKQGNGKETEGSNTEDLTKKIEELLTALTGGKEGEKGKECGGDKKGGGKSGGAGGKEGGGIEELLQQLMQALQQMQSGENGDALAQGGDNSDSGSAGLVDQAAA